MARLFFLHGCFVGTTRAGNRFNPGGYFENIQIDRAIKQDRNWLEEKPDLDLDIEGMMVKQGHRRGPWLVKCGALWYRTFEKYDPFFIGAFRPEKDILESYDRCRFLHRYNPEEREHIVRLQLQIMERVCHYSVHTDRLVEGDRFEIRKAIEGCGLQYNARTVEECVRPEWFTAGDRTCRQ